jgi:hypothetical protein
VTIRASDESLKNNTRDFDISKELKKPSANVLARSRIDLDGDRGLFLPQNEVDFDLKIIALHKENVDIGL